MMLHVISDTQLRYIERAIVEAVRDARELSGKSILVGTIDAKRLRQAAKIAVAAAISDDVWDDAETYYVPAPRRQRGVVNVVEEA